MDEVDEVVKRGKPLQRGQELFTTGQEFTSLYAVRSGAIKAYNIDENGDEQVIGFFLPGAISGLTEIDTQNTVSSAQALETTAIC